MKYREIREAAETLDDGELRALYCRIVRLGLQRGWSKNMLSWMLVKVAVFESRKALAVIKMDGRG